jgi:hypothetical protein
VPTFTEGIHELQARTDWKLAGEGLANTGAKGRNALTTMEHLTDRLTKITCAPDLTLPELDRRWTNCYWYLQHGPRPESSLFNYDVEFWMPPELVEAPQGIELDMQKQEDSIVYNMALQLLNRPIKGLRWYKFGGADAGWVTIPGTMFEGFAPGWNHAEATYEITNSNDVLLQALAVNGNKWEPAVKLPAFIPPDALRAKYSTPKFNTALQLDLNGVLPIPTAYHIFLGEASVSIG